MPTAAKSPETITPATTQRAQFRRKLFKYAFLVVIVLVALLANYITNRQHELQALTEITNQACVGIGVALQNDIPLKHYDFEVTSSKGPVFNTHSGPPGLIGSQQCWVGTIVTGQSLNADGSGTGSGYKLGATITYFNTPTNADNFGQILNKGKYWSVDDATAKANYPQSGLHTFLTTNVSEPYFESYTVHDNFAVYLSLPCQMTGFANQDQAFDNCNQTARTALRQFADKAQKNL